MNMAWSLARNVLCVRLDTMSDVLMTTPALRALKESCVGRRLTLLTSPAGAEVAALVPEIDDVIVYDAPWVKTPTPRAHSKGEYAMIKSLRQAKFDAAVVFTEYNQDPLPAAFLCYLVDIPLRLAYWHENPPQLLTHWAPDHEPESGVRHEVRRQLDLVATINCRTESERLSLRISDHARLSVGYVLRYLGIVLDRPWMVIHPGAAAPSRRYPPEAFAQVARLLVREHRCQVLFTGVDPERDLVAQIQAAMAAPSYSLVDQLDLEEMAALIARAPLLIANNTGPVHLAAAVGTPVVDLYALTHPQHTPWAVPHRTLFHDVPCKYCYKNVCPEGHHHCLRLVKPETIVAAARELLSSKLPFVA